MRSRSVVPSVPPFTYSTATHGSSSAWPSCTIGSVPTSMKRTTNGVGGTRSFSLPSAIASFLTISAAVGPAFITNEGRRILMTTGVSPSAVTRSA